MNANEQEHLATPEFPEEIGNSDEGSQGVLPDSFRVALKITNSKIKRRLVQGCLFLAKVPFCGIFGYLLLNLIAGDRTLTTQFLSDSLRFYRSTSAHCKDLLISHQNKQQKRVLLCGLSELTEIAARSAQELGMEVVGIYAPGATQTKYQGKAVWQDWNAVSGFECCMITDLTHWSRMCEEVRQRISHDRVMAPDLMGLEMGLGFSG